MNCHRNQPQPGEGSEAAAAQQSWISTLPSQAFAFLFASSCNIHSEEQETFLTRQWNSLPWDATAEEITKPAAQQCRLSSSSAIRQEHSFLFQLNLFSANFSPIPSPTQQGHLPHPFHSPSLGDSLIPPVQRWTIRNSAFFHAILSCPHRLTKAYSNTVSQQISAL